MHSITIGLLAAFVFAATLNYSKARRGPLQTLALGLVYMSAGCMWLELAARAAWDMRDRWGECVNQARREI